MARKHNTKHPDRGASHYPDRLAARGLSRVPAMATVESLRKRQATPEWLAAHPWVPLNIAAYRGVS
jgi:hypothetical protein